MYPLATMHMQRRRRTDIVQNHANRRSYWVAVRSTKKTNLKNKRKLVIVSGVSWVIGVRRWSNDGAIGLLRWTWGEVGVGEISESTPSVACPRQSSESERVGGMQQRVQPTNITVATQRVCTETQLEVIERRTATNPPYRRVQKSESLSFYLNRVTYWLIFRFLV